MLALWRFVSLLTAIVNRLLLIGLAGVLVFDALRTAQAAAAEEAARTPLLAKLAERILAEPTLALAGGVVLLVLELDLIQFVLYSLANAPSRAYIASRTAGGQSRVALSAIERALRATAAQVPEIARSRIRVQKLGANRYRVHIRFWARGVHDAGSAAEHLRLVLKKRFSELVVLDPKDKVSFDLDLAGIRGRAALPQRPKALPAPHEDPPSESFRGPVYPVGGDGD